MIYYLKLGFILLIFCVIASGILAYINTLTAPVIAERKAREEEETRAALIPDAVFEQKVTDQGMKYFLARDPEDSDLIGYTFIAAEIGYSSTVQTMVGVDKDFEVLGIEVIDQSETPGLGANCTSNSFTAQFSGLSIPELYVDKDGGAIVSLSGATITSRTIANSLRESILDVQDEPQGGAE
jgi:Na+-translocating ferredoxin:NAD+ oxidoreductase subunit G